MTDQNQSSFFEKPAVSVWITLAVILITWAVVSISNNQIQYARIDERLVNQSVILNQLQSNSLLLNKWRNDITSDMALIKQRVDQLEKSTK